MKAFPQIEDLARERPEWSPWLAFVRATLDEAALPEWQDVRCRAPENRAPIAPLLSDSTIDVHRAGARRVLARLGAQARGDGAIAAAARALASAPDAVTALEAAINRDIAALAAAGGAGPADAQAFAALAGLVSAPVLHACAAMATVPESWTHGYCPVCGSWPAYAEEQGVERSRRLRCGDCGCGWPSSCLQCVYCGNADHERLHVLVPDREGSNAKVEACDACSGYLKVVTTLRASGAQQVMLRDLATVELDIAATERRYARPARHGYPREVRIAVRVAGD